MKKLLIGIFLALFVVGIGGGSSNVFAAPPTAFQPTYVTPSGTQTLTNKTLTSPVIGGHATIEGVTPTGATGTGKIVFDGTPTIATPVLTNPNIVGTATNNAAAAGSVGEYVESYVSAQTVTTSAANLTSISLTAGDWDVSGMFESGSFGASNVWGKVGISQTTGTLTGSEGKDWVFFSSNTTAGASSGSIPRLRVSLSGTTTIYLVTATSTATITSAANGYLSARRMR